MFFVETQEALSRVVTKTPLTEKLLSKPPFRYLHDLILEMAQATRFGLDVLAPEELDASNIQDKDAKLAFLGKIIKHVGKTGIA